MAFGNKDGDIHRDSHEEGCGSSSVTRDATLFTNDWNKINNLLRTQLVIKSNLVFRDFHGDSK